MRTTEKFNSVKYSIKNPSQSKSCKLNERIKWMSEPISENGNQCGRYGSANTLCCGGGGRNEIFDVLLWIVIWFDCKRITYCSSIADAMLANLLLNMQLIRRLGLQWPYQHDRQVRNIWNLVQRWLKPFWRNLLWFGWANHSELNQRADLFLKSWTNLAINKITILKQTINTQRKTHKKN